MIRSNLIFHCLWLGFTGFPFIATRHWVENPSKSEIPLSERKENPVFGCLQDDDNDFSVNCHSLAKFYGLSDFVVISPAGNETLSTESRINLVLSSITLSVSNIQW